MTQETIKGNMGRPDCSDLSGPELTQFDAEVGDPVKIDIAELSEIATTTTENNGERESVVNFKPVDTSSSTEENK